VPEPPVGDAGCSGEVAYRCREVEVEELVWSHVGCHRRREQVELVTLGGEEVVGHDVIVAIGPLQVVDLTRATRDFADRLKGFVQQAQPPLAVVLRQSVMQLPLNEHTGTKSTRERSRLKRACRLMYNSG
jgi:hypothetical protein